MRHEKDNRKRLVPVLQGNTFNPRVELISNREALVEGCEGIVEYNDSTVSINCKKTVITFEGADLNLRTLAGETAEVTGLFSCISFSSL